MIYRAAIPGGAIPGALTPSQSAGLAIRPAPLPAAAVLIAPAGPLAAVTVISRA